MIYPVTTPRWLRSLYPGRIWSMPGDAKIIYLSFDDGPDPEVTPFVLDELDKFNAKATFFCIGRNVEQHPEVYRRLLQEGHAVGNHTYDHCNGWKTADTVYLESVQRARQWIDSSLFRPPYGRIRSRQVKKLQSDEMQYQTVMWSILSGDFDTALTPEDCLQNVLKNTGAGDIVVFHDSQKAFTRLCYTLPRMLNHFAGQGFCLKN